MSDLIGRPWKPGGDPPPEPRPQIRRRRESRQRSLGFPPTLVLVVVTLILVGGAAAALATYRQIEERRQVVSEQRERFADYLADREAAFGRLFDLNRTQLQQLRRSVNAQHVEAGRRIGISSIARRDDVEDGVQQHGLIRLDENPTYWVSRLTHSVPYVTADAAAAIDSIAVRFEQRLADLGLPLFQFNITSVLRTREDQARLRGVNINAARGASSHEFGTTFDVHYQRFRYAADAKAEIAAALGPLPYDFLYDEFGRQLTRLYQSMAERKVTQLGAELGRVLIDLENSGKMLVIREARQPVYHITVRRSLVG